MKTRAPRPVAINSPPERPRGGEEHSYTFKLAVRCFGGAYYGEKDVGRLPILRGWIAGILDAKLFDTRADADKIVEEWGTRTGTGTVIVKIKHTREVVE